MNFNITPSFEESIQKLPNILKNAAKDLAAYLIDIFEDPRERYKLFLKRSIKLQHLLNDDWHIFREIKFKYIVKKIGQNHTFARDSEIYRDLICDIAFRRENEKIEFISGKYYLVHNKAHAYRQKIRLKKDILFKIIPSAGMEVFYPQIIKVEKLDVNTFQIFYRANSDINKEFLNLSPENIIKFLKKEITEQIKRQPNESFGLKGEFHAVMIYLDWASLLLPVQREELQATIIKAGATIKFTKPDLEIVLILKRHLFEESEALSQK